MGTAGKGRVTERVVDGISRYIESQGLTQGDKLPPERVFMEQFAVGRSSVREALRVLTAMGVVEVVHGGGTYVANPGGVSKETAQAIFDATEENALRNLVETRLGIELAAVTVLAQRGADEDFAALEALLDDQWSRMQAEPGSTWEPLAFELAVAAISGNTWLHDVEEMLRDAWVSLSSGLRASVGRHAEWHAEHRAILASIRSRNVLQAQRLVMAHLSLDRFEEDLARSPRRGRRTG